VSSPTAPSPVLHRNFPGSIHTTQDSWAGRLPDTLPLNPTLALFASLSQDTPPTQEGRTGRLGQSALNDGPVSRTVVALTGPSSAKTAALFLGKAVPQEP
jgi:hypothetical protein